jgi:hypothetical protein
MSDYSETDSQTGIRERPRCRKVIVEKGLSPNLVNEKWDRMCTRDPDGRLAFMSDGLRKQMRKMIAEGFWNLEQETPDSTTRE